jgi:anti-sigma factor RsiW
MTPERFAELVEVYGAEPRRWPQGRRHAAITFTEDHPEEAAAIMETARSLDEALDRYTVSGPSATLIRMIMETASIRAVSRRMRLWRQGVSFAAVGLAGALAGALAVAVLVPMSAPGEEDGGAYAITAFSDMAQMTDD